MSHIDDMIAALAPNGVERRTLGDIAELVRGNGMPKTDLTENGVGAIHYGQIYTHYGVWTDSTTSYVSPETAARLSTAGPGDIIITNTSENIEDVCKAVAWLGDATIVTGGHATVIKHSLEPKYLAYWFQSQDFASQKRVLATGTKVIDVSARQLAKVRVPVPPLEIQREIARILDQFTRLEAELEAELEARRRQYAHYRSELLSFSGEVPMRALGDLARNLDNRRKPVTKDARTAGDVPYYGASGVVDYVSDFIFDGDYLLVSEDGANLLARSTPIAFSISGKTWVNNHAHVLEFGTYAERRFVEIYLNSIDLSPYVSGAAQPKLNKANLNRISVPDPALADKERVVALLDKFEALVNDLSIGLPAELAARRKQYGHYRDRLLTFQEAAV